jgi:hypothetical protein
VEPADNEDMIEDRSGVKESGSSSRSLPNPEKAIDRRKPTPRKSAVSAHVDPMAVLTQLLSTPVQLQVGEVLGISKELSGLLNDSIKLKSGKPLVASSFVTRTRGVLIKLHMECNGIPVVAIIDTGSQLNIVSKAIWKSVIKRPMDIAKSLTMNDANGGEGILRGLVQHVPLTCGIVSTEANLYVGEHVPFQLLLGRPWQRGNYVSIDERCEGTYLLFKDPHTLKVRYEIMVNPESPDPTWDFDPSIWKIPANLLITVPEHDTSASNQERATQKARNVGYLIWKSGHASASVLQNIFLAVIYLFLAVLQILVNWLEYASHKLERKHKTTNSPIMSYPQSGQIINTTIHEDRTPVVPSTISEAFKNRTAIEIVVSVIRARIRNLEARLDQIQASEQAHRISNIEELLHTCGRNHSLHTCDDHLGKKVHMTPDGPAVHQSRTARRKERRRQEVERKRRERSMQDSADEEDSKRRDDKEQREVDKLVQEVHKSLGNGNIPNIRHAPSHCEDRLYSDNKNSPIHVLPPSHHDVVFLNNPNMPALLFAEPGHAKKLSPIDCPMDIQAASLHEISKSQLSTCQLPAPVSCADVDDSDSICSSRAHSSMPPLEEMSVSSDSGSDMDLESVNSESHGPTATHTSEELMPIKCDVFRGLEDSSPPPSH